MAVFTQGIGLDVCRVLAGCSGAVVTADTAASDAVVVEDCTRPAVGTVAVITGVTGGEMVWCLAGRS